MGFEAPEVLRENLKMSDVAVHTMTSTVIGVMDNDDWFQHLGGALTRDTQGARRGPGHGAGRATEANELKVESISKIIGKELRTRYLNPKWIDGMKKGELRGAREMSKFVEHMWGWQVTTPFAVDEAQVGGNLRCLRGGQYGLDMKIVLQSGQPLGLSVDHRQNAGIDPKGILAADETTKRKLAAEYAVNVVSKGVACCDHTCKTRCSTTWWEHHFDSRCVVSRNRREIQARRGAGNEKTLDQQTTDMVQTKKTVNEGLDKQATPEKSKDQTEGADDGKNKTSVEGYKMEEVNSQDKSTELPSSGAQWYAILFAWCC